MAKCRYLLCPRDAKGLVVMTVLNPRDEVGRRDVAMCNDHADSCEIWFKAGLNPHITDGGELYVGELDELVKRR